MRISDWSSDVCSSDLDRGDVADAALHRQAAYQARLAGRADGERLHVALVHLGDDQHGVEVDQARDRIAAVDEVAELDQAQVDDTVEGRADDGVAELHLGDLDRGLGSLQRRLGRSEEHTSELQSLLRISY